MTIGILKSPNPRNQNSISVRDKIEIFIRLFDEHFARHFESHWRETWRHTGRRTVPQISLETPLPPPSPLVLQARPAVLNLTILISCYVVGRLRLTLNHSVLLDILGVLNTNLDLFRGSKVVQYDWLLASQSGCCRFDPFCPKAWVVFFKVKIWKIEVLRCLIVKFKGIPL